MAKSKTSFVKGICPNPGGRARGLASIRELARTYTLEAIKVLADIAQEKNEKSSVRIAAANAILDRAWGRPEQGAKVRHVEPTAITDMTTKQLQALIQDIKPSSDNKA